MQTAAVELSFVDDAPITSFGCISHVQVTNPVQFEQSLANVMGKGFEYGYECGPGKVVAGILKRVDKKASMTNVEV